MRRIDLTKAQAARSSTIRDINRQFVLNYIRDREPISRAEIARVTALQRSTVSTIVEELKAEGLIEEIGAGASTGGRRPTMLRLRAAGATAVGVDVTPTHTTVASCDLKGRVLASERVENAPARPRRPFDGPRHLHTLLPLARLGHRRRGRARDGLEGERGQRRQRRGARR